MLGNEAFLKKYLTNFDGLTLEGNELYIQIKSFIYIFPINFMNNSMKHFFVQLSLLQVTQYFVIRNCIRNRNEDNRYFHRLCQKILSFLCFTLICIDRIDY